MEDMFPLLFTEIIKGTKPQEYHRHWFLIVEKQQFFFFFSPLPFPSFCLFFFLNPETCQVMKK